MIAVRENQPAIVKLLIERGADVNARSYYVPSASGRGFEGTTPVPQKPTEGFEEFVRGLERGAAMRARWTRELLARESWDMLLQVFTEPHYNGFPAVLVVGEVVRYREKLLRLSHPCQEAVA